MTTVVLMACSGDDTVTTLGAVMVLHGSVGTADPTVMLVMAAVLSMLERRTGWHHAQCCLKWAHHAAMSASWHHSHAVQLVVVHIVVLGGTSAQLVLVVVATTSCPFSFLAVLFSSSTISTKSTKNPTKS